MAANGAATNGAANWVANHGALVPEIGARVVFRNARTQLDEFATVTAVQTPLNDGTVIVSVKRDLGGITMLPLAALSRVDPGT